MTWLDITRAKSRDLTFARNTVGRPIIPRIFMQENPTSAPKDVKVLALEWANSWLGIYGEIDADGAIAELEEVMAGRRRHRDTEEGLILLVAARALYGWHHAARCERTKHAFPWLQLVVIDHRKCCASANALNGELIPYDAHQPLPLQDCDAKNCMCTYLQWTEGKRLRSKKSGLSVKQH